jgi:hypothetical protein
MAANSSEKEFCVLTFLDYCDVCRITKGAHIEHLYGMSQKLGSFVLLNEKIHILLSQVYCVWQVVKTPTIILNNPVYIHIYIYINTGCPGRNVKNLRRVFLMLKYTDITQNTYIQSWTVTEIMAREKCGLLAGPLTVSASWKSYQCMSLSVFSCYRNSSSRCICTTFRVTSALAFPCHV